MDHVEHALQHPLTARLRARVLSRKSALATDRKPGCGFGLQRAPALRHLSCHVFAAHQLQHWHRSPSTACAPGEMAYPRVPSVAGPLQALQILCSAAGPAQHSVGKNPSPQVAASSDPADRPLTMMLHRRKAQRPLRNFHEQPMLSGSGLVKCMARIDMDPRPKPLKCAAVSPVLVMARRVSQELVGLVPCPLMAQPDGIPRWHRPEIPVMLVVPLVRDRQALLEGRHQQIGPRPGHVIGPHVGLVLLLAPSQEPRHVLARACSPAQQCVLPWLKDPSVQASAKLIAHRLPRI
mmetsp:Transcript_59813/g.142782  ORF Transcript_59813/g.142782 Transcript_59813/m.142782 type:complete len:293 (-) Transcript_59813:25-903(-)